MADIKSWLKKEKKLWSCDFIGVAVNTAPFDEVKEIRWRYTQGPADLAHEKIKLRVGRGIAGLVWQTARPQSEKNLQAQPEKLAAYPISRTEKLDSVLAVPVLTPIARASVGPEVIGVLMIGYQKARDFSPEEVAQLTKAAAEVANLLAIKEGEG
ncbi:GAF domain-containing protein [Enterococcus asini]|uniref:GAF domain-containing protein n=1 Tax=Enterococcus asini TaxID=57732 RepID=UPI00288D6097|nr:GAF domain-containing protein [Enterococcus asini]MDT2757730.1 GAF domain-containing protein [Enterococcus asini]